MSEKAGRPVGWWNVLAGRLKWNDVEIGLAEDLVDETISRFMCLLPIGGRHGPLELRRQASEQQFHHGRFISSPTKPPCCLLPLSKAACNPIRLDLCSFELLGTSDHRVTLSVP